MAKSITLSKKLLASEGEMVRNLLAWYALAKSNEPQFEIDKEWYVTANEQCKALQAKYPQLTLDKVIDVVAAISPGMPWPSNIRNAEYAIETWCRYSTTEERKAFYLTYHTGIAHGWVNYLNAWAILDGVQEGISPEAQKTYRFADNIRKSTFDAETKKALHLSKVATIDQHMIHILNNTRMRGSIGAGSYYLLMERVVIMVAEMLGLTPEQLQAAVWALRVALFEAGYDVDDICAMLEQYMN